jgi:hypothetical protein
MSRTSSVSTLRAWARASFITALIASSHWEMTLKAVQALVGVA